MSWFKKIAQQYYDPDDPREEGPEAEAEFTDEEYLPVVTPENIYEYEPAEETTEAPPIIPPEIEDFTEEIPERFFVEDERSLIEESMRTNQCLGFTYTSLKGKTTWRLVEPYGTFVPGTGRELVCCWDRTVNGIRSFCIDNIHSDIKIMPGDFYHFEKNKFVFRPY